MIDGDHVRPAAVQTESCHPQAVGHHGDYIDYVKQAEEKSCDPLTPVVKVQPIRIEGFGSDDLNIQHNKDDKVSSSGILLCYYYSLLVAILCYYSDCEIIVNIVCYL